MEQVRYKTYTQKVEDIDFKQGIVKIAVNAFGNVDHDGDMSEKTSFNRTIKNQLAKIKHLAFHNWEKIMGLPIEFNVTDEHLIAVSKLNIQKPWVYDIFTDYLFFAEEGRTLDHSIGAIPIFSEFSKELNANVIKEWKLLEYSTVMLGANENTPTLEIKDLQTMLNKYDYSELRKSIISDILQEIENKQQKPTEQKAVFEAENDIQIIRNNLIKNIFTNLKLK